MNNVHWTWFPTENTPQPFLLSIPTNKRYWCFATSIFCIRNPKQTTLSSRHCWRQNKTVEMQFEVSFNFQGPQKEYLGKLQYELKYDFNTQARIMRIIDYVALFVLYIGNNSSTIIDLKQDVGLLCRVAWVSLMSISTVQHNSYRPTGQGKKGKIRPKVFKWEYP